MKLKKMALLLLALCVVAPAVWAVPAASFRIRADIDFDFYVGSKRMPKGEYMIESVNDSGLVRVTSVKKGKSATILTVKAKMTNKPKSKLGFRRYGEQYFLRKIWDGENDILEIKRSSAEKKAAKAIKGKEDDEGDEVDK